MGDSFTFNFDFNDAILAIERIKSGEPSIDTLMELRGELNAFFKGINCKSLIYTKNTDNMFFGICTFLALSDSRIASIVTSSDIEQEKLMVDSYDIELDSRLFSPILNLSAKEILSLLIFEISSLTNSSAPIESALRDIDSYLSKTRQIIPPSSSSNYAAILSFGLKDLVRKHTSIFFKNIDDVFSDIVVTPFIDSCKLRDSLVSACEKLVKNGELVSLTVEAGAKSTIMPWCIQLYNNIKSQRIQAIRALKKSLNYTASRLIKRETNHIISAISRIDDSYLIEGWFGKTKFDSKDYRSYENDYFELVLKEKNILQEDDAILLLHQINNKISILSTVLEDREDYELDDSIRSKLIALITKYEGLRDKLGKREIFKYNYDRIYINYPEV